MVAWEQQQGIPKEKVRYELDGRELEAGDSPSSYIWSASKGVLTIRALPHDAAPTTNSDEAVAHSKRAGLARAVAQEARIHSAREGFGPSSCNSTHEPLPFVSNNCTGDENPESVTAAWNRRDGEHQPMQHDDSALHLPDGLHGRPIDPEPVKRRRIGATPSGTGTFYEHHRAPTRDEAIVSHKEIRNSHFGLGHSLLQHQDVTWCKRCFCYSQKLVKGLKLDCLGELSGNYSCWKIHSYLTDGRHPAVGVQLTGRPVQIN